MTQKGPEKVGRGGASLPNPQETGSRVREDKQIFLECAHHRQVNVE